MKECWINGDIVTDDYTWYYDFFGMKCTTPADLKMDFAAAEADEEIVVHVNSGGGMVTAGMEIYSMIAQRKNVTVMSPSARKVWIEITQLANLLA